MSMETSDGRRERVQVSSWMQWFVGASEQDVIDKKAFFIDDKGNLINHKTGKLWPMGTFECPSIASLRQLVHRLPATRLADKLGDFAIQVIDGTDIADLQASLKTEQRAMVQIASNFHCLENGSPHFAADDGDLVSGYATDSTQGPAAAFGVPAASLLRAHYVFKAEKVPEDQWGQSADRQVNLIEDICKERYCGKCVNGKALLMGREKTVTAALLNNVSGMVKVGLHSDAQVVFQRGGSDVVIEAVADPQLVDQVCSATLCYGYVECAARPAPTPEQLESLARACLRAAYEGAYLAAIQRERKILLLTLIGGASFRNPMNVILEELKRAHEKYAKHPASQLEEVYLVLYDRGVKRAFENAIAETKVPED
mmetsp:Transcript_116873/g.206857  ORF Transcript_116873/g.206857 Transcript_116873/m.206857 type:complete len:370 (-) Transcript_116873:93-1202(-)